MNITPRNLALIAKRSALLIMTLFGTLPCFAHTAFDHINKNAIVRIIGYKDAGNYHPKTIIASGFFINDQGDIAVNASLLEDATEILIEIPLLNRPVRNSHHMMLPPKLRHMPRPGMEMETEIIRIDHENNLALIRPNEQDLRIIRRRLGSIPYLPLANSDEVHRGDTVSIVGYPREQRSLENITGTVNGFEGHPAGHLIQINASIQLGNGGGYPCLNANGEVIGIISSRIIGEPIVYATPSNKLQTMLHNNLLRAPMKCEKAIITKNIIVTTENALQDFGLGTTVYCYGCGKQFIPTEDNATLTIVNAGCGPGYPAQAYWEHNPVCYS